MDKKPLIGLSILVVVLLVLGSLSVVVGYQSVKLTINDSLLFNIRIQRATNQQKNIINSQYLGIGNENLLQFQIKDTKTGALKNAIEIINKMDDKTFHRFVEKIKTLISQKENTKDIDFNDIENALHQLKKNSEVFQLYKGSNSESQTIFETPTGCWFPGCILGYLIVLMIMIWSLLIPTGLIRCGIP